MTTERWAIFGRYRNKGWYIHSFTQKTECEEFHATLTTVLQHAKNERTRSMKEWAKRYKTVQGYDPEVPDPDSSVYFLHLTRLYFALQQALVLLDEQAFLNKDKDQILPDVYLILQGNFDDSITLEFEGESYKTVDEVW